MGNHARDQLWSIQIHSGLCNSALTEVKTTKIFQWEVPPRCVWPNLDHSRTANLITTRKLSENYSLLPARPLVRRLRRSSDEFAFATVAAEQKQHQQFAFQHFFLYTGWHKKLNNWPVKMVSWYSWPLSESVQNSLTVRKQWQKLLFSSHHAHQSVLAKKWKIW